jgi:hypothetical protein
VDNLKNRRKNFGRTVLGPIYAEFCERLWLYQEAYSDRDARALFASRGGLRLREIYEEFLRARRLSTSIDLKDFMISRILATKVCFEENQPFIIETIMKEFQNKKLDLVADAFLPPAINMNDYQLRLGELRLQDVNETSVRELFFGSGPLSISIQEHLKHQRIMFSRYIKDLLKETRTVLLVDTGLFGSTQKLLSQSFPEYEWRGHYFAKSNYRSEKSIHLDNVTGIILDCDSFSPIIPESALLKYWHLIEMPLEPKVSSVRYLMENGDGAVRSNLEQDGWEIAVKSREDSIFGGIMDYIENSGSQSRTDVRKHYKKSIKLLSKKIQAPIKSDLLYMTVGDRSNDFHGQGSTPILPDTHIFNLQHFFNGFRRSLWLEGQIIKSFGFVGFLYLSVMYYARPTIYRFRKGIALLKSNVR